MKFYKLTPLSCIISHIFPHTLYLSISVPLTDLLIGELVEEDMVEALEQSRETGSLFEVRDAMAVKDRVAVEQTTLPSIL